VSAKSNSRARRLIASLDRIACDINPYLIVIAFGLACIDAIFLVVILYGEPGALTPNPATDYSLPATAPFNELSGPQ
jgi:hypothetical protein